MSLKELFPLYPLILRSPRKTVIKFGTRNLYVDLPWQAYYFLFSCMAKATEGELTTLGVKKEWSEFLRNPDNREVLTVDGKPFVSISLRSTPLSKKRYLRLDVKWDLFIEYLERKATHLSSKIERSGENIMEAYREIWTNFFNIVGFRPPPRSTYLPHTREAFRRLLERTGDYTCIENTLGELQQVIDKVEDTIKDKTSYVSVRLYTINLTMYIQHLRALIDIVNIPAAYLTLRNLLETFIKFFIYLDVGKDIKPNILPYLMFFYEYETRVREGPYTIKRRIYSLKRFREDLVKKVQKILSSPSLEESNDLFDFIYRLKEKLKEKQLLPLGINSNTIKEFSEIYAIEGTNLTNLYSACSSIIHNQPPLPFFSLLEVKIFKHFLSKYLHSFTTMAEKLINMRIVEGSKFFSFT